MSDARGPSESVAGIKAERRNLTVLFADIVGSSALAARLDPEDVREIVRAVQGVFRDAVSRFDGHVARYLGDGVLAYFGFPVAHEDDAERAVNAALQMVDSVSRLSFPHAAPLQLHIGIATGLVVVGDLIGEGPSREFDLIGEAPNLAAWLQQHAEPNQILISSATRRLVGRVFETADLGERAVKGHQEPARVWSVLRPSDVQSRFDARRPSQLSAFLGRASELEVLHGEYEKAKGGDARLVAVSGEPGIGKSRLAAALRERVASEPHRALLLQCSSYHTSSPWYPIIRFLEDIAGLRDKPSSELKLRALEDFVARSLDEPRQEIVQLLAALLSIPTDERYPPLELTPQQQKRRTLAALLDLLRAQAEKQPVILLFEDVHWIDPSSLELLQLLRYELSGRRILTIVSYRSEFDLPWENRSDIVSIVIRPLEPADAARMVRSLSGERSLPDAVVEEVVRKTDGVPLFIEEVTNTVVQDLTGGSRPAAPGSSVALVIPDTLQDSLMARIDKQASMKVVAQVSAAIGREFALDLLEAVAPLAKDEVAAAIESLVASGLLFRQGRGSAETYVFKHALVQDAAYSSMLRDDRRKLHFQIAEALCEKFGDVAESAPELVAHHYTQAQEARKAVVFWSKAGRKASERSAFIEASRHFQSALGPLAQWPESAERHETELQLQHGLASAFIAVKGYGAEETARAFDRALELCEKLAGTPHIFAVLNGLVGVHYMRGDFERSRRVAEDLLARASRGNDATALLMGHRVLGISLCAMGELRQAQEHLKSAIDTYDAAQHAHLALVYAHDFKATAQVYLGLATVLLGDVEAGLAHGQAALAYAEELRHPHSICYVLPFLAGSCVISGSPQAALPIAERAILLSTEYGFPQWVAGGLLLRGWARLELGEVESGLADIRESIDGLEATGTLVWMQFARFLLAEGLAKAGHRADARELVDRILDEISAADGRWYEAEVHRLKGDLLLAGGTPAGATASYEAARAVAIRQGARLSQLRAERALRTLRRDGGENTKSRESIGGVSQRRLS